MVERIKVERLIWDSWNLRHILKHQITRIEIDQVMESDPLVFETYRFRHQLIGEAESSRIISVIVGQSPDEPRAYYDFSARPASRKERRVFMLAKGIDRI